MFSEKGDFTIIPKIPKFNKIVCNETINNKYLDLLISSSLLQDNKDNIQYYQTELQQLKKYKAAKGRIQYNKKMIFGRSYCYKGIGLQYLRKEIRHTLSYGIYTDIDIVNCHPTLLLQILKTKYNDYKERFKGLYIYIKKRVAILESIQSEYNVDSDTAKNLFIRILYGGSFNGWCVDNKIVTDNIIDIISRFEDDMKIINTLIESNNPAIKKDLKKNNKEIKSGTITSYFLQEIENQILEEIFDYMVEHGYIINNNCALCFDGIMIPTVNYKTHLLTELNGLIKDKFNFDLKFIEKPLHNGYDEQTLLNNLIEPEKPDYEIQYEILKEDFEKNNFKVLTPLLYATINSQGELNS